MMVSVLSYHKFSIAKAHYWPVYLNHQGAWQSQNLLQPLLLSGLLPYKYLSLLDMREITLELMDNNLTCLLL